MASAPHTSPEISVVVPVYDEEGAAPGLAREIAAAFRGRSFELIFVDDASHDGTRAALSSSPWTATGRTIRPTVRRWWTCCWPARPNWPWWAASG